MMHNMLSDTGYAGFMLHREQDIEVLRAAHNAENYSTPHKHLCTSHDEHCQNMQMSQVEHAKLCEAYWPHFLCTY